MLSYYSVVNIFMYEQAVKFSRSTAALCHSNVMTFASPHLSAQEVTSSKDVHFTPEQRQREESVGHRLIDYRLYYR